MTIIETFISYYLLIGFIISIIVCWGVMYKDTIELIQHSWVNIFSILMFMSFIMIGYSIIIILFVMDHFGLLPHPSVRDDNI